MKAATEYDRIKIDGKSCYIKTQLQAGRRRSDSDTMSYS